MYPNYYAIERGVYNTISSILGLSMLFFWQPITEVKVMQFSSHSVKTLFFVMSCLFALQGFLTIPFLMKFDLMGFRNMSKVLKENELEYPRPLYLSFPFIYRGMRHPRLSSILGIIIFSSTEFNLGRVVFIASMIVGTVIGAVLEEYNLSHNENYRKYLDIVPNRFVFDIFEALDPENEKKLSNLEISEESSKYKFRASAR